MCYGDPGAAPLGTQRHRAAIAPAAPAPFSKHTDFWAVIRGLPADNVVPMFFRVWEHIRDATGGLPSGLHAVAPSAVPAMLHLACSQACLLDGRSPEDRLMALCDAARFGMEVAAASVGGDSQGTALQCVQALLYLADVLPTALGLGARCLRKDIAGAVSVLLEASDAQARAREVLPGVPWSVLTSRVRRLQADA
jgi:hypothetical protein